MPARSKDKRKEILRRLYHFCLFNIGTDDDGNIMRVRLPNYDNAIDTELRNKAAHMTEEEWVSEASAAIDTYNRQRKVMKPMDELLPGFEARQTAIDFEKVSVSDNLGQLIIEARRIADALERLARGMDSNDIFHVETH